MTLYPFDPFVIVRDSANRKCCEVTSIGGGFIAANMGPARVAWSQAIQERIGATSSALTQMKGVKMMGLSDFVQTSIQELRISELKMSTKFRWILTRMSILGMCLEFLYDHVLNVLIQSSHIHR